jgi:HSP20 family protein
MKTLVRNYDSFPAIFNELFNNSGVATNAKPAPSANIKESEEAFEIELALPGFKKEDFKIEVQDKSLTVSSESKTENEDSTENYIRKEFSFNSFSRSFRLPRTVDSDQIAAEFENGILTLTLPKREEAKAKEPRLIAIN